MRAKKKLLKSDRPSSKTMVHIRLTEDEATAIEKQAQIYTGGNRSAWIRYAALYHKPSAKDSQK